jgi:uncharacterized protein (DUF2336 family)
MDGRAPREGKTSSDRTSKDGAGNSAVVDVTAETFRMLTVRLRTRRVATPEAAALLIKAIPEPAPGTAVVSVPEPTIAMGPRLVPEPTIELTPDVAPEPVAVSTAEPVIEPIPDVASEPATALLPGSAIELISDAVTESSAPPVAEEAPDLAPAPEPLSKLAPVPVLEPEPEPTTVVMALPLEPIAEPLLVPEPVSAPEAASVFDPVTEPVIALVPDVIEEKPEVPSLVPEPPPLLPPVALPIPEPEAAPVANLPVPIKRDTAEVAGEAALRILDLMVSGQGLLPQERALAADALLLLLPRMAGPQRVKLAERVASMDTPPPLVAEMLIRDPRPEVMAPVLERSAQLCDRDIMAAAPLDNIEKLRIVARRRVHSPVLSGHLVASGDPAVILALLRNPGSQFAPQVFSDIAACAVEHPALLPPLVNRPELPVAVAFELYWCLPSELRRLMLSRFLTDSMTLGRILRMATTQDDGLAAGGLREERTVAAEDLDAAIEAAAQGRRDEACQLLAGLSGFAEGTVRRILSDPHGEALVVLFKVMEVNRTRFLAAIQRLRAGGVLPEHPGDHRLQTVFESMPFTKARVLVTYWDWFTRRIGPYAAPEADSA